MTDATRRGQALRDEVQSRLGVLPNFFTLTPNSPEVTEALWGFAKFGYLDNPLPSVFKERLFVYVSRFCNVRYCLARHVGFLIGLGRPSGDAGAPPQTVEQVIDLVSRPHPGDDEVTREIEALRSSGLQEHPPAPGSDLEASVFCCAGHVFNQTTRADDCMEALKAVFMPALYEHLLAFLTFIKAAHFWTQLHPELELESDLDRLYAVQEQLAQCVMADPGLARSASAEVLLDEVQSLRRERVLKEELQHAVQALQTADRRKDEFLATLAHELRNPLAPIQTGLELLSRIGHDRTDVRRVLGAMERQTRLIVRLVNDLLDVSRITQAKLRLSLGRCDLAAVLRQARDSVQESVASRTHVLTLQIPDRPLVLEADAERLAQVFGNLLDNACKYTPPGGEIAVGAAHEGEWIRVWVTDNGLGLDESQLDDIFEMFSQVETSRNVRSGLGVGLALVRSLVEMHGGTVSVRSDGLGAGATFEVRLPAGAPASAPDPEPDVDSRSARPIRLLVADDNAEAGELLGMLAQRWGCDVRIVHDGEQAVEMAGSFQPDLVLLDLGMPGMGGLAAGRAIRAQPWGKAMPIVALTGWGQDEDHAKTKAAGFDRHVVKPISAEVLESLIHELCPTER